jgi:hypothetical protein
MRGRASKGSIDERKENKKKGKEPGSSPDTIPSSGLRRLDAYKTRCFYHRTSCCRTLVCIVVTGSILDPAIRSGLPPYLHMVVDAFY